MNKICTSIKQSEKLIKLGIDFETADMYYTSEHSTPSIMTGAKSDYSSYIPAWSLTALLGLIPNWQMQTQDNGIGILYGCKEEIKIIEGETPLDAAFQMVVWLKENGKI